MLPDIFDGDRIINSGEVDEVELLAMIRRRVAELIEVDPALLFSYMYRLDIEEQKIKGVLNGPQGIAVIDAFAQIILDRQLLRMKLRKEYQSPPIEGWDW
ncbi:MAG: hypothetical protein AAFR14_00140 [Bacteroidota bacterium]